MSDLYDMLFGEKQQGQKGNFITNEEGRVIFVGGPGAGSGEGSGGTEVSYSGTPESPVSVTSVSESSRMLRGENVNNAPELAEKITLTQTGTYILRSGNISGVAFPQSTSKGDVFSAKIIDRDTSETIRLGYFVSPVDALATIESIIGVS